MKTSLQVLFVAVIGFLVVVAPIPASAADEAPTFGFINVSQALLFHPLMRHFDTTHNLFRPEALNRKELPNRKDDLAKIEKDREARVEARAKLEKELQVAAKQFGDELAALDAQSTQVSTTKGTELKKAQAGTVTKKRGQIETDFWKVRERIQGEMAKLDGELEKLGERGRTLHLTTPEETATIFKVILDDVYNSIDQVAKAYKLAFIFNSSFIVNRVPANPKFRPENPMGAFFDRKESLGKEGLYKHGAEGVPPLMMTLRYWTGCGDWVFKNTNDPRLDRLFIRGGHDMTGAVVDAIYQKYGIDKAHRDTVVEFFNAISQDKELNPNAQ